jgi:hypothetical protein
MGLRSHVDCWTRTSNIIRPLAACLLGCAALAVSQSTSAPGDITISELQDRVGELELALASGGFIASRDLDTLFVLVSAVMVFCKWESSPSFYLCLSATHTTFLPFDTS